MIPYFFFFFFFNDTATTEIYTLSLHDALPDLERSEVEVTWLVFVGGHHEVLCKVHARFFRSVSEVVSEDRKSTRLNSSHTVISYAVFCLKKKKKININQS